MYQVGRRLLRNRALRWGVAYVLLVPCFGTAFWVLGPHSFYDANIEREAALANDASSLSSMLSLAVRDQAAPATWSVYSTPVRVERDSVSVSRIRPTPDHGVLLLDVVGRFKGVRPSALEFGTFGEWLSVNPSQFLRENNTFFIPVSLSDERGNVVALADPNPPVSRLLPIGTSRGGSETSSYLRLPLSTYSQLVRLLRATQGDPFYASDRWSRLTYLSAVTVTTVGFGDITPVSAWARRLVAIEAVLGLVFIGFFLNSVAQELRTTT